MRTLQKSIERQPKSKKFWDAYEEEGLIADINIQIAQEMQKQNLSQEDMAKRMGTHQQAISRLLKESRYTIRTLCKIARALGKKLQIRFV